MINNFYIKCLIRTLKEFKLYNKTFKTIIYKHYLNNNELGNFPYPHLLFNRIYPSIDKVMDDYFINLIMEKYIEDVKFALIRSGVNSVMINNRTLKFYIQCKDLSHMVKELYGDKKYVKFHDIRNYIFYGK